MYNLVVRNVNQALPRGLRLLALKGVNITPRGARTFEYPEPVATTYTKPWERVLFNLTRDANPFFHLMESLWILDGRQDVAWIGEFNGSLKQFSDNGVIYHGAYGHRLRSGIDRYRHQDQLKEVVSLFKKDINTRRAVLQIWDSIYDLNNNDCKDIPCVMWDTEFMSPEAPISAKRLAQKFRVGELKRYPVYGMDPTTGDVKLTWMTNCWKSGDKPVLKITFSDGGVLKCTEDHRIWLRGSGEVHEIVAGQLRVGDTLAAVKRSANQRGHWEYKKNLFQNTQSSNMVKEHQEYMRMLLDGPIPDGFCTHHLLGKLDNRQLAISLMSSNGHLGYHKTIDNPMHKLNEAQRIEKGARHSQILNALASGEPKPEFDTPVSDSPYQDNHINMERPPVVIGIESLGVRAVFDFTVPETSNAAVSNGVFVHNCNDLIMLKVRNGCLNMTVCNRSNDIIWGAYGANAVQFSILQEYLAAQIGVSMGTYTQMSDSYHVYPDNPQYEKLLIEYFGEVLDSSFARCSILPEVKANLDGIYTNSACNLVPLVTDPQLFDAELHLWMDKPDDAVVAYGLENTFFERVATPMVKAWRAHKLDKTGMKFVKFIEASDWRVACSEWLWRRGDTQI